MEPSITATDICQTLQECQAFDYIRQHRELFFGEEGDSRGYADDATWIMTSAFIIFTMQTGFGLVEMGSCQAGHEVNILLKNVVDVLFGSLAYYLFGYAISFGQPSNSFMGMGDFAPTGDEDDSTWSGLLFSRYIFQMSFAATSTTIVSGCVAMRMRFFVYCAYSFFSIFIYAFVAHWVWASDGWLNTLGAHDFAGGGPVHLVGGVVGLIGTLFLGPRTGRFDGSRPEEDFLPVSPTSILFGLFMLWWGWIGFNCGSTFGVTDELWVVTTRCAITTINATVAGGIFGILQSMISSRGELVRPEDVTTGILGSLVAITPACDCVNTYDAFPVGAGGAVVAYVINKLMFQLEIDDPVGAVGVHGGAGIWGLIAVGLFSDSSLNGIEVEAGLFYGGGGTLLWKQTLATVVITVWATMLSSMFFYAVGILVSSDWRNPRGGLRVTVAKELVGADSHLHGLAEWQQEVGGGRSVSNSAHDLNSLSVFDTDNEQSEQEEGVMETSEFNPGRDSAEQQPARRLLQTRASGIIGSKTRSFRKPVSLRKLEGSGIHEEKVEGAAAITNMGALAKSRKASTRNGIGKRGHDHPYRNYRSASEKNWQNSFNQSTESLDEPWQRREESRKSTGDHNASAAIIPRNQLSTLQESDHVEVHQTELHNEEEILSISAGSRKHLEQQDCSRTGDQSGTLETFPAYNGNKSRAETVGAPATPTSSPVPEGSHLEEMYPAKDHQTEQQYADYWYDLKANPDRREEPRHKHHRNPSGRRFHDNRDQSQRKIRGLGI